MPWRHVYAAGPETETKALYRRLLTSGNLSVTLSHWSCRAAAQPGYGNARGDDSRSGEQLWSS